MIVRPIVCDCPDPHTPLLEMAAALPLPIIITDSSELLRRRRELEATFDLEFIGTLDDVLLYLEQGNRVF